MQPYRKDGLMASSIKRTDFHSTEDTYEIAFEQYYYKRGLETRR